MLLAKPYTLRHDELLLCHRSIFNSHIEEQDPSCAVFLPESSLSCGFFGRGSKITFYLCHSFVRVNSWFSVGYKTFSMSVSHKKIIFLETTTIYYVSSVHQYPDSITEV